MVKLTERDQIRGVAAAWARQYPRERLDQRASLQALDAETATRVDVATIIGNTSWTDLYCHECGYDVTHTLVVEVGEPPDYDSSTARLCVGHLRAALALAEAP